MSDQQSDQPTDEPTESAVPESTMDPAEVGPETGSQEENLSEPAETTGGSAALFDFRKPGGLALENADSWRAWMEAFQSEFPEKWMQLTRYQTEVSHTAPISLTFDKIRKQIPNPSVACQLTIGEPAIPTLLVFPRPAALGMVLQLLGEDLESLPEDRALSTIETSLCEVLFKRILDSLADAWPEKDPLPSLTGQLDMAPHRCRHWDPGTVMSLATLSFSLGAASGECQWILPQAELEDLLSEIGNSGAGNTGNSREKMEQCLHRVPVQVHVELGQATVSVARLARLKCGDIVVLDQRIHDPLPLVVEGKSRFFGWLGKSGNRQAFNIIQTG